MEYGNLYSACCTKPLPCQVLDVMPGFISQTSGFNQVHGVTAAKEAPINPRSVTILTLNSRRLTASLTTYTRLRRKEQIRHPSSVNHESCQQLSLCSFPQSSLCKITTTPPLSSELIIQPYRKSLQSYHWNR